ncbi:hypothetical protein QT972_30560 [Microcoleus sp. herbarium7]
MFCGYGSSATDCVTDVTDRSPMEVGSSATDVTDVTDVKDRRKFGSGLCSGCNG